jgi:isoquinoline 1-oxidoreductase beta subunit
MPPVSRRFLLTGAALTAASLLVPISARHVCAAVSNEADCEITDWIMIAASGRVTLGLSQPEVGQGSYTVLPQILAEELEISRVHRRVRPQRTSKCIRSTCRCKRVWDHGGQRQRVLALLRARC